MQPNEITVTVDGNPVIYRRYTEMANTSTYIESNAHTLARESTLTLRRARSSANRATSFPGNSRPSLVFKMTSDRPAPEDGCCTTLVSEATALAELSFQLPSWGDDATTRALIKRLGALLQEGVVLDRLTTLLEI